MLQCNNNKEAMILAFNLINQGQYFAVENLHQLFFIRLSLDFVLNMCTKVTEYT